MTKTTNYHLPQWAAADPVRREDFNQAFAALDGVYSPDRPPYVSGSVTIPYTTATNTAVLEFNFEPHHILVVAGDMTVILQGGSGTIHTSLYNSGDSSQVAAFYLRGKQVILGYFGSNVNYDVLLTYVAYR